MHEYTSHFSKLVANDFQIHSFAYLGPKTVKHKRICEPDLPHYNVK